ncbi:MAG: C-GCAxxG-C-C family protein [Acutalibacteraceae bacterium]|nr:C-GCAxxG-C-C family protein [Acutalibacteraceae bacterium]
MSDKIAKALELHSKGFNCAQSVAIPFCDELGIDPSVISRAAEGFGGGMGGYKLTCGALSGAVMVAGLKFADGDLEAPSSKQQTYKVAGKIGEEFEKACGSTLCPIIKGLNGGQTLKSCNDCIALGVTLAEQAIK